LRGLCSCNWRAWKEPPTPHTQLVDTPHAQERAGEEESRRWGANTTLDINVAAAVLTARAPRAHPLHATPGHPPSGLATRRAESEIRTSQSCETQFAGALEWFLHSFLVRVGAVNAGTDTRTHAHTTDTRTSHDGGDATQVHAQATSECLGARTLLSCPFVACAQAAKGAVPAISVKLALLCFFWRTQFATEPQTCQPVTS
jgi:hypothetical protein